MLGGISVWQLLIILIIVVLLFGTKKLKNMGRDLGGALRGFKEEYKSDESNSKEEDDNLSEETHKNIEQQNAKNVDQTQQTTEQTSKEK
ncbi:Sec-independent protein translocase subunit TatA [Catenovulum adriaticum]|uniref:Sec-independent protein translocase protein TatA n=1 Tax=Catenovulum adriaticum TaxID=2984846 RepID=A0ABY7ANJ4_9ALTE|nr:Sec-independent protein translocase subunit TatA [Catenovulum sp. TS8]WAJ70716.1 Sec-independent protein translocase subunit TatA [Catenovulum sp. TS8]